MRPNVPTARLTMLTPVPANILIFGEASCWSSTSVAEASLMSESPLVQMVCLAIIQRTAVGTARTSASQSMKSSMPSSAIDGVLLGPPAALKAGCAPAVPCDQFFPPTCPVHCETPVAIVTPRSARHHSTQLAPMMVAGVTSATPPPAAMRPRVKRGPGRRENIRDPSIPRSHQPESSGPTVWLSHQFERSRQPHRKADEEPDTPQRRGPDRDLHP